MLICKLPQLLSPRAHTGVLPYHYKNDGQAFIHREKPPLRVKDPRRQKLQMLLGFKRKGAVWTATAELTELERELDIRLL